MPTLHFAHLTDVHISEQGTSWSTIGALDARLLTNCIAQLNAIADLDFVLITGDVLEQASHAELHCVMDALAGLHKPWHFVPGNHDGFIDPDYPDAYQPHEAIALLDPRLASPTPFVQKAHWSRAVAPGIRLIGLDSRHADDWDGEIDEAQLAWLATELEAHRDELIIIAVHHPLHPLGPHNARGMFTKFICNNGPQVETLLDRFPNVRLVLAGHHHANRIVQRNGRLHINTAALTGYPCSYRTIRLVGEQGRWRVRVETHSAADEETLKQAYAMAQTASIARQYNPHDLSAWAKLCEGGPDDLTFEGELG